MANLNFTRNKDFLSKTSSAGITVSSTKDPKVAKAIAENTPFPKKEIKLGQIAVSTKSGKDIEFKAPKGKVTFKGGASASAYSGIGVYPDPAEIGAEIALNDNVQEGLKITAVKGQLFSMLRWGYDLQANVSGAIALSPAGGLTFGAEGKKEGMFAVIRQYPNTEGAQSLLKDTLNSWMLPSRVTRYSDLRPGTWIVSEINSSIGLTLGGQFGYDFNWVKEAQLGGLSGDIGLRLQLGVKTALGFKMGGKFAVVISRSADKSKKHLRLRLFKQRMNGWNFALDAGASVQGDFNDFAPKQFDDLIKAVFGLHGSQVLKEIEKWTDPTQDLSKMASGVGVDYVKKLVGDVTGLDPETAFEKGRGIVSGVLQKWNALDHELATKMWKLLEDKVELDSIRDIVKNISEPNEKEVRAYIEKKIEKVDFLQSKPGQFLMGLIPEGKVLQTLTDTGAYSKLVDSAKKVSDLLDGGTAEKSLVKLQDLINKRLSIDKIDKVVKETDFKDMDAWLKSRLSGFIGQSATLAKVQEVRKTIKLLSDKRQDFYEKTLKALNKKYALSFNAAYQKTTTKEALIDVVFDYASSDPSALLKEALAGNFNRLFVESHSGVLIKKATLTHNIQQSSSVEIDLPFFKSSVSKINNSLAKVNAVDEDDGRILIYELNARDVVTRRNRRMSSLTVGGHLPVKQNSVNVYSEKGLTYSYAFREAKEEVRRVDLEYQLRPYVDQFLFGAFEHPKDGTDTFDTWLTDLDKTVDRIEHNGSDNFGKTLLSLEVTVPPRVASAWLKAPSRKTAPEYQTMSRGIQRRLKQFLPLYHFQNTNEFKHKDPSAVLLAYAAIAPSASMSIRGRNLVKTKSDIYWNWRDKKLTGAMVENTQTTARLVNMLHAVHGRLRRTPNMTKTAKSYRPERATKILRTVSSDKRQLALLETLFRVESDIVYAAQRSALDLAKFSSRANTSPTEAIEALANFGSEVTKTFNRNIKSKYGGKGINQLGALLFIEAALAMDPELTQANANAIFDIIVLRQASEFDVNTFLKGKMPRKEDIIVQERLLEMAEGD